MKRIIFIFFLCMFQSPAHASANEFLFVGQDFEPYYFKDGSVGIQGATYDVMKEVCTKLQMTCKFKIAPHRHALNAVKDGTANAGGPYVFSQQRTEAYYFSKPLFNSSWVFVGRASDIKKINSYSDLAGMTVAALSPSMTWISLNRINQITGNKIKLREEASEINSLRKTENKNYNFAYVPRDLARAYFSHNPSSNLKEVPKLGEPYDLFIILSKKSVSPDELKKINTAIEGLFKTSFMKDIAAKYNLVLATTVVEN